MNDSKSASLVLIAGAVGIGYWFYHLTQGRLAPASTSSAPPTDPTGGPALSPHPGDQLTGSPLARLEAFARQANLRITSETGGTHNPGSLHYSGRAIDVSARGLTSPMVQALQQFAASLGIRLRDERTRPPGQAVWSAPHLHFEVPVGGYNGIPG